MVIQSIAPPDSLPLLLITSCSSHLSPHLNSTLSPGPMGLMASNSWCTRSIVAHASPSDVPFRLSFPPFFT
jgi:hypothetical protein